MTMRPEPLLPKHAHCASRGAAVLSTEQVEYNPNIHGAIRKGKRLLEFVDPGEPVTWSWLLPSAIRSWKEGIKRGFAAKGTKRLRAAVREAEAIRLRPREPARLPDRADALKGTRRFGWFDFDYSVDNADESADDGPAVDRPTEESLVPSHSNGTAAGSSPKVVSRNNDNDGFRAKTSDDGDRVGGPPADTAPVNYNVFDALRARPSRRKRCHPSPLPVPQPPWVPA